VAVALVLGAAVAAAQSLADVARQEEARRKKISAPGKVYTDDDVKTDGLPPPAPAAAAPATAPADPKAGEAPKRTPAAAADTKDEAYWKKRLAGERDALNRAEMFAEALQNRINGLTADFTARDDPAQRAVIAKDREKALNELTRVRKDVQDHTKAIAAIQEEGRKAGVPAGWLR
jgi:hypothetical protein